MSVIKHDSYIKSILRNMPSDQRDSFSDEQLIALKRALIARERHSLIHLGGRVKIGKRYYAYKLRISAESNAAKKARRTIFTSNRIGNLLVVLLLLMATMGLLYILKSAMGINIFDSMSMNIW